MAARLSLTYVLNGLVKGGYGLTEAGNSGIIKNVNQNTKE